MALGLWSELNAGNESDCRKQRNDGRASVAEEWERDTDNGGDAHAHSDVYKCLEGDRRSNAVADEHTEVAAAPCPDNAAADNDKHQQRNDNEAGDHTHLLTDRGEDTVGVSCVDVQRAVAVADTVPAPRLHRLNGAVCLPADALARGVYRGIVGNEDAVSLVLLKHVVPKYRCRSGSRRSADADPVPRKSARYEHDDEYRKEYDRRTHVLRRHHDYYEHSRPVRRKKYDGLGLVEDLLLFVV